jgi:hypothetical protein
MVKITNFAEKRIKKDHLRPKTRFFEFAAICRSAVFSCGKEKRIGKHGKISCRMSLFCRKRKIKIMKPIAKSHCICYNDNIKSGEAFIKSPKRGNMYEEV